MDKQTQQKYSSNFGKFQNYPRVQITIKTSYLGPNEVIYMRQFLRFYDIGNIDPNKLAGHQNKS
jgi:hypothetical protein